MIDITKYGQWEEKKSWTNRKALNNEKRGKARETDNIRHSYENPLSARLDPKYTTAS
jgi:hypothetical protein